MRVWALWTIAVLSLSAVWVSGVSPVGGPIDTLTFVLMLVGWFSWAGVSLALLKRREA